MQYTVDRSILEISRASLLAQVATIDAQLNIGGPKEEIPRVVLGRETPTRTRKSRARRKPAVMATQVAPTTAAAGGSVPASPTAGQPKRVLSRKQRTALKQNAATARAARAAKSHTTMAAGGNPS